MRTFSRKMLAVMLAVLMLCVMAPVSAIAAELGTTNTNLIQNGDFETGNSTGWSLYQNTKVDATAAKDGSYGLHIAGNGGWGGMGKQVVSGLEIGQVYRFSYDYKAITSGVNVKLCAGDSDSGSEYAYIYATKTEWTKYTVEFEATTTNACFALVGSGTNVAEEMYMDNISLTKVVLGAEDDDPNRKAIDTLKSNIKTQGRTAMVNGTLMLDFTISGMEFELDCEGDVYATFNARKLNDGGVYFTILVDGVRQDRLNITSIGETKVKLASDLPAGKHTFAIYRQSEHSFGEIGVCALSYVGEMLAKPADKGLYVEFIGDSISCGYGNIGNDGSAVNSDGTQGYTYLTAQALNADWSTVSWSGLGCKYGYSSTTMQDVYPAQRYNYDKATQYSFSNQPDIVVLALGTNDNSKAPDTASKRAGLVEMLTLVREKNPTAPIVWIHGMMTNGVSSMIEEIVAEFGGAEAGYYSCRLTQNNAGGGSHPSLAGQQTFADELVAFIQANGLDVVEPEYVSVISGGETSRMEMTSDKLGLAFKFEIAANGIEAVNGNFADLTNATVDALGDGNAYKLVSMGAVVSNDIRVGKGDMTLDSVDGKKTLDIAATRLQTLDENGASYAVRIINIPLDREDSVIFARAYYVVEIEGELITVYGDVYEANYAGKIDSNDGVLDWN